MFQITGIPLPSGLKPEFKWGESLHVGGVVYRLLLFSIIGAGLFFFVRLITAGYGYLTNAGDQNKIQSATKELTNAVIGFLIVISAYFIIQIVQVLFGVKIL